MNEQDYIPGTRVIANLIDRSAAQPYGTPEQVKLDQAENIHVTRRLRELRASTAPEGKYTFGYMRGIHRHLFQDVYAWAGEPRRVPMSKFGTVYASPSEMNQLLREQYTALAGQNYLRGIPSREEFTRKLAAFWGEINHGHAFREGNTRSQTVFFSQLAKDAGWELDVARLSPHHERSVYAEFVEARFEHQRLRQSSPSPSLRLAQLLAEITTPHPSMTREAQASHQPARRIARPSIRRSIRVHAPEPARHGDELEL